ncbi:MAG: methyltransferase domain-containing protein [Bacteroidales bacterium]|nr:methyltransferase domain-containing protein [Bacteroidales bacterium]MCF8343207.1 methyltransferase domain-containing protein [Bacteroidales bacterium]MCF8351326.1 methyltransferase domain-containing protein [Bacteroidales bacterium]MCF8376874.1 methyltransferase domain-containing protein [Bacteroidales bacterium]MCF8401521.1 methyltransferase domain-containing protein [Bacteroidales bacterium]
MEKVRKYYNRHRAEEDKRLDYHVFEMPVTRHFINQYISPGEEIFDASCGTGHYAEALIRDGYKLGLNDLADENIRIVKERLGGNPNILFIERSEALESKGWEKRNWDAVLLMGPLYHMISREKRLMLLKRAAASLNPGGFVFSAFMTRSAALVYGLKNNPEGINYPDGAEKLWQTGADNHFVEGTEAFTNAYFVHPSEINPLMAEAGLKPLHLAGAEGVFGERFDLYHNLNPELKKKWLNFIVRYCEDEEMVANSKHLLSVARKINHT